ncbi:MAG: hypothetical protein M3O70_03675 [Actinomycetota bacterium]|nr:hypothetical protein [Actinomycetota bacterium]
MLAEQSLPGLMVLDDRGRPVAVLPGSDVLRLVVSTYFYDRTVVARAVDERHADLFLTGVGARTVREYLSTINRRACSEPLRWSPC